MKRHAIKIFRRAAFALILSSYFCVQPAAAQNVFRPHYRLEALGFENAVSKGYGNWHGGGLSLTYFPSTSAQITGGFLAERRPGDSERLASVRVVANWSSWFYTDTSFSGGGRDDPAAFFPRFRYDLTANVKPLPLPGLILNAGYTKIYFGAPVNVSIVRVGAVYYWRRFVFQGNVNFNDSHPGYRTSQSGDGAVQYGQEGHYWIGASGGGGTQAWQTVTFAPQNVQLSSFTASVFARKWLAPRYGAELAYHYTDLRTAYRIHGLEARFFWDF